MLYLASVIFPRIHLSCCDGGSHGVVSLKHKFKRHNDLMPSFVCPKRSGHWNRGCADVSHRDSTTKWQYSFAVHCVFLVEPKGIIACCEWPLRHQIRLCRKNSWCSFAIFSCTTLLHVCFLYVSMLFLFCNIVTVISPQYPPPHHLWLTDKSAD